MKTRLWPLALVAALLLVGCRSARPDADPAAAAILQGVEGLEAYLVEAVGLAGFGGEVFCAFEPLDAAQGAEGWLYVWAYCQEYVLEQVAPAPGSAISVPVALEVRERNGAYEIVGHRVPRDGSHFGPDVEAIFPQSAWSQIMPRRAGERRQQRDRVSALAQAVEARARARYGDEAP